MDVTQILITVLALIGIVVVGLLAVVPTVLNLSDRRPSPVPGHRSRVDLAA